MPAAEPHFDVLALLHEVQKQDVGLVISTNNPAGFRRIFYAACRADPALRSYCYQAPDSAQKFWLLKAPHNAASEALTEEDANVENS